MAGGVEGLKQTLIGILKQADERKSNTEIQRGQISGNYVLLHGKSYPFTLAVDVNVVNGMYVWCELYQNTAVIVGA